MALETQRYYCGHYRGGARNNKCSSGVAECWRCHSLGMFVNTFPCMSLLLPFRLHGTEWTSYMLPYLYQKLCIQKVCSLNPRETGALIETISKLSTTSVQAEICQLKRTAKGSTAQERSMFYNRHRFDTLPDVQIGFKCLVHGIASHCGNAKCSQLALIRWACGLMRSCDFL